jgi:hypothetical protein
VRPLRALVSFLVVATASPSLAWAQARPSQTEVTEAKVHFARGVESFKEGDNRAALAEFDRAYKLAPNFRLLYNIAQTCAELEDYPCALRSMQQYLADGKAQLTPARRAAGEKEVARFQVLVATLTVQVNVTGAQILVDDRPVGTSPLVEPVMVSSGQHRIAIVYRGLAPVVRVIEVAGADAAVVDLEVTEPAPAPPPPPATVAVVSPATPVNSPAPLAVVPPHVEPSRAPVWIGAVSTVALGSAAAVTGMLTLKKHQDLQAAVDQYPQPGNTGELRSQNATLGVVTDALVGATVVAAGTTLVFLLTRRSPVHADVTGRAQPGGTGLVVRF